MPICKCRTTEATKSTFKLSYLLPVRPFWNPTFNKMPYVLLVRIVLCKYFYVPLLSHVRNIVWHQGNNHIWHIMLVEVMWSMQTLTTAMSVNITTKVTLYGHIPWYSSAPLKYTPTHCINGTVNFTRLKILNNKFLCYCINGQIKWNNSNLLHIYNPFASIKRYFNNCHCPIYLICLR